MLSIPPCHSLTVQKEHHDRDQKEALTNHAVENKEMKKVDQLEKKPSMDINESAEAFINKFRKQLLIQRLESIENYEQMLARGL